jgi:transcriptional regulator with XRE-family HTH domain
MTGIAQAQAIRRDTHTYAYTFAVEWTETNIRRERESRGLSQRRLAQQLSAAQPDNTVSERSVTAWENGESRPSGRNIAALDRVLGPGPDTSSPTLTGATDLELIGELARRMGLHGHGQLPDRDLRLPRRRANQPDNNDNTDSSGVARPGASGCN